MNGRLITLPCVVAALLIAVVGCVSPRDHCEEYRSLNSMREMCFYELGNLADCREQLALGAVSEEDCERKERIMIYSCLRYATDSERCSKEIDLPIVPKIVNRQIKPDVADFIRWRMARSQGKAMSDQPAI